MKYIFLLFLISYTLCTTRKGPPAEIADIYKGFKTLIYKCILNSEKASAKLKELANNNLNSEESQLSFHSIDLTSEDRQVLRNCRKEAFRKKNTNGEGGVTAIGVEQAVHSKKYVVRESRPGAIRQLSIINSLGLGAINIAGIFPCLENAQPAIKVIRDTINLFKSQDFTGAIVYLYDNFHDVAEGLTYCINTIFPPD